MKPHNSKGQQKNRPSASGKSRGGADGKGSRGSRRRSSSRSGSRSSRSRPKLAYALLALIAVMLIVILAFFPGGVGPGSADSHSAPEPGRSKPGSGEPPALPAEGADESAAGTYGAEEDPIEGQQSSKERKQADQDKRAGQAPELYIVIDDVGYDRQLLAPFLALQVPVTYAVLPRLSDSQPSAELIEQEGDEYLLHQPMEAIGGNDPGPGVITGKMGPKQIQEVVSANLKKLPQAKGVNNHMGSKGTTEEAVMKPLLQELQRRELFFLDSRTTAHTIGRTEARRQRVPFSSRNVFLDNKDERRYIEQALAEAWEIARQRGQVIMIGHVWSRELPAALADWIPQVREEGGEFRFLSEGFKRE